ncbi:recombinase family protein [Candidatus Giovannonibacteria bacterium]|nr:recombinase family protein [Candidatus Giovannonibacteria bacterium]
MKYFLYIRKSTDEDDRQVLSLEAQETELKEFALRENLLIAATFRESQTAKEPGRPIFNDMLKRMERGEAEGILAWHPDRLARNSIDGGRIIFLVDTEKIRSLKSPTFWFEPTPQGKFMLNIAFGQSKYFVDNLSVNTKRGLRQKLRRGELPGYAPLGYLNDLLKHTIYKDPERFRLVRKLFELYATGNYSLKDLRKLITSAGLLSRKGNMLSVSNIQNILSTSFYYGVFKYNGELYDGKHEPMIAKKLFEACQKVMADRSRPKKPSQKEYPFRNLLKCGECGCAITSETQKGHNYYRCTKKKDKQCSQKYIREEVLARQISDEIQKVSLPPAWAEWMLAELNKEEAEAAQAGAVFAQNLKNKIKELEGKLDLLLDAHLASTISREEYTAKKEKLIIEKAELSEKLKDFERNGNHWLEPARQFILAAQQAKIIALQENPVTGRDFLKRIGSNHVLRSQAICFEPKKSWKILADVPAEGRSPEAVNSYHTIWLPGQDSNLRPTPYTYP